MKVLNINFFESQGGAAKAVNKLHKFLIKNGIESFTLVIRKTSRDNSIIAFKPLHFRLISFIDLFPLYFYTKRVKSVWGNAWFSSGILKKLRRIDPDIVQLNWVSVGMISIKEIGKIDRPIVWRLSDSWAFTGGCHIPYTCERYKVSCGQCPILNSGTKRDLSYYNLKKKLKYWKDLNLTIVAPSNWMANCAKQSSVFKNCNVEVIPTGVDINVYKPINKLDAKDRLNIPVRKKVVLFGAFAATSDKNKGYDLLVSAIKKIDKIELDNYLMIVFGSESEIPINKTGIEVKFVGVVSDINNLIDLYSAADVFVLPSLLENLSNVLIESCACGTPVVAFDSGGNSDIIDHKNNGYLVKSYDVDDLCYGIQWVLNNINYDLISKNARKKVLTSFDLEKVSKKYEDLYKKILINK